MNTPDQIAIPKEFEKWAESEAIRSATIHSKLGAYGKCKTIAKENLLSAYRHLMGKPSGLRWSDDIVLAILWDGTGYTWWVLNKAEMPFKSGPMGGKTFYLLDGDNEILVSPGDWILKDSKGKFHRQEA